MISFGRLSFSGRQIFLYLSKAEDNHGGIHGLFPCIPIFLIGWIIEQNSTKKRKKTELSIVSDYFDEIYRIFYRSFFYNSMPQIDN